MKYLPFLFMLCGWIVSAQPATDRLLNRADFKLTDGRMVASKVDCVLSNESAELPILISIVCMQYAFDDMGVSRINDMIKYANGKVRKSVAGDYTPSEFKMAYNPSTRMWSLTNLFSVQESGVTRKSLMALDFDSAGNFLEIKRIF